MALTAADDRIRTSRCHRWCLWGIVVASTLLRLPALHGDLTDGMDSWRQTDTATIARNFLDEPRILWPRINWGAPGPGYVEAEFQLYPFTVSLLYLLFGENPLYGRLLSIFLAAICCLVFWRISRRYLDETMSLVAVAFLALAPVFFNTSRLFMPEATVMLFYLLALERFLGFLDTDRWRPCLESAIAMALAILVKPTSIHLGLVLIVLSLARFGRSAFANPRLIVFALVSLVPSVLYYAHAAMIHHTYGNTFGVISGGDSKWGGPSYWFRPHFYRKLAELELSLIIGPVAWILAAAGLFSRRSPVPRLLGLSWAATLLFYYMIVARYSSSYYLGRHYHVYATPLAALLVAAGASSWFHRRCENGQIAPDRPASPVWWRFFRADSKALFALQTPACLAILVATFIYMLWADVRTLTLKRETLYRAAGQALATLSDPDQFALTLSSNPAYVGVARVPNNFEQPNLFFYANRRGRLLAADRQTGEQLQAALAFGPSWFVNFTRFNEHADRSFFDVIESRMVLAHRGDGFDIYRVRPDS